MSRTATMEPRTTTDEVAKVPTITTPEQHLLLLRVEEHVRLREHAKTCYAKSDQLFELVQDQMEIGQRITLSDGRIYELVDNFAESNVAFRPAAVKRFELAEVTKP